MDADSEQPWRFGHTSIYRLFKLVKGGSGTTSFLPLDSKKDGPVRYVKDKKAICLTGEKMRYIDKKVESGSEIKVDIMKQEIDKEELTAART